MAPIILETGRKFFMRFSLNIRESKLNFDDVQLNELMTVFEPEIKIAAINRKKV